MQRREPPTWSTTTSLRIHVEHLQLDVVGVAEGKHRVLHGAGGIGDTRVLHPKVIKPRSPGIQVRPHRYCDRNMVNPGPCLVAWLSPVRHVVVQADHDPGRHIGQNDGVAGFLVSVVREPRRYPLQPEHPLVPRGAGLDVRNGWRKMMEATHRRPLARSLGHGIPPIWWRPVVSPTVEPPVGVFAYVGLATIIWALGSSSEGPAPIRPSDVAITARVLMNSKPSAASSAFNSAPIVARPSSSGSIHTSALRSAIFRFSSENAGLNSSSTSWKRRLSAAKLSPAASGSTICSTCLASADPAARPASRGKAR